MHTILFARNLNSNQTLHGFSTQVLQSLGLNEIEERESSNYPPDGHYFIGRGSNGSVKVMDSDDESSSQYPYWVVIESKLSLANDPQSIPLSADQIATLLASSGLQILVPSEGWETEGWVLSGVVYGG